MSGFSNIKNILSPRPQRETHFIYVSLSSWGKQPYETLDKIKFSKEGSIFPWAKREERAVTRQNHLVSELCWWDQNEHWLQLCRDVTDRQLKQTPLQFCWVKHRCWNTVRCPLDLWRLSAPSPTHHTQAQVSIFGTSELQKLLIYMIYKRKYTA